MQQIGSLAPTSVAEAKHQYELIGPAAQTVVREVAKAMDFDRREYSDRVTENVVATAREALFASLLEVSVGSRSEYEQWCEEYGGSVTITGHELVDNVVWHSGPNNKAVAATFQDEQSAAIATLRRQAFGRLYRDIIYE